MVVEFLHTIGPRRRLRAQDEEPEERRKSRDEAWGLEKERLEDGEEEGKEENRESDGKWSEVRREPRGG